MPTAPLARCTAGCGARVRSGRCEKCRAKADVRVKESQPWRWVYSDPRWPPLRNQVRAEEPRCRCGCGGLTEVVDHITPHRGDEALAFDRANLQGLTKVCHDRKTALESGLGRRG
jgi:5-methylcytosine-specific restriction protein A